MFSRSTNADRDRRCADLLQRAELVRTYGWEDYRAVWSAGEVAAVAPSSAITTYSANEDEALQSVWACFSFDLWGVTDA